MNAVQPGVREAIGPFVIQSVLKTRAAWEGVQAQEMLLVSSSSVRWLVNQPLTDAAVRSLAVGERVLRRDGTDVDPPGGRVVEIEGDHVWLKDRDDGEPLRMSASDYQLVARPALVYQLLEQSHSHAEASSV